MMHADGLLLNGGGEDYRKFTRFFAVSVACHLVVFLILVFAKGEAPVRRIRPGVINVDLVSLSAPSSGRSVKKRKVAPPLQKKQKKKKVAVPKRTPKKSSKKKSPVLKKKKIIGKKKSGKLLKKKTVQSAKVVDSAIAGIKKKVEQSRSQSYQKTMERLAEQVRTGTGKKSGVMVGSGSTSGARVQSSEILAVYAAEIYSYISKNWSFNEQLADDRGDLVALLGIKIMADGEIQKVWFDRKSGNLYFDEQARKAVLKTGYLPPLPPGFTEPFLEIGLRFTPHGIQ